MSSIKINATITIQGGIMATIGNTAFMDKASITEAAFIMAGTWGIDFFEAMDRIQKMIDRSGFQAFITMMEKTAPKPKTFRREKIPQFKIFFTDDDGRQRFTIRQAKNAGTASHTFGHERPEWSITCISPIFEE